MALSKNSFECFLGGIITPAEYYVVSKLESHVEDIKNLEKMLSDEMNNNTAIPNAKSILYKTCVAVRSTASTDVWQRGEVRKKIKEDFYSVFLIDHGYYIDVARQNLRVITDAKYIEAEPLAFKICLYGIIPKVTDLDDDGKIIIKVSEFWSKKSKDFVKWVLTQFLSVNVKKIYLMDRVVYGDLILFDKNKEEKSLRKLLVDANYAVYSERYYQIKVMSLESHLKVSQDTQFSGNKKSNVENNMEMQSTEKNPDTQFSGTPYSTSWNESDTDLERVEVLQMFNVKSKENDTEKAGKEKESSSCNDPVNPGGSSKLQKIDCGSHLKLQDTICDDTVNLPVEEKKIDSERQLDIVKYDKSNNLKSFKSNLDSYLHIKEIFSKEKVTDRKSSTWLEKAINLSGLNSIAIFMPAGAITKAFIRTNKKENLTIAYIDKNKAPCPFISLKNRKKCEPSLPKVNRKMIPLPTTEKITTTEISNEDSFNSNMKKFKLRLDEDVKTPEEIKNDKIFQIFTSFSDSVVEPTDNFRDLNISRNIIMNLQEAANFKDLTYLQRWAIPSILRGHNVVMISGPKSGKTLSYVIAITDLIQDEFNYEEKIGNGPLVVILCSGSNACEYIYNVFRLLFGKKHSGNGGDRWKQNIYYVHGNGCEEENWVNLTNGVDVLITTPHCLVRLLNYRVLTNFDRLRILIIDEVDIIMEEPFLSQVKIILHRAKTLKNIQKVFCGEKWTPEVSNLWRFHTKNHVLLIGSHLEAAIYAKLQPNVLLLENKTKVQVLYDLISKKIGKYKILIACEDASEVQHLENIFRARGHTPLIAHSGVLAQDIKAAQESWKYSKEYQVFIFSDEILNELFIQDAEILIHYSLPYKSKTNFAYRFSTLMNNYKKNLIETDIEKQLNVIILVDEQNHFQLPHVVDFVLRLGGKVPVKAVEICEQISTTIELRKKDVPLCVNVLKFGDCKAATCNKRHIFIKEIDCPEIPITGFVKFEVLYVYDVSHLSVRITENIISENVKNIFKNLTDEIQQELEKHFKVKKNRRRFYGIKINDLCALELTESGRMKFYRAKVIENTKSNSRAKFSGITVKAIDFGWIFNTGVSHLYEIPEELKKYPPQAIDAYLCNLLPKDFDSKWGKNAKDFSKSLFLKKLKPEQHWIGKVALSLKNSLHLQPVKLCQFLENLNVYVVDSFPRTKILSKGYAVQNEKHLKNLFLLCKKAKIEMMENKSANNESKMKEKFLEPQWAFLDKDLAKVRFISAENTSMLFIRLIKFEDLLLKLEKECQTSAKELETMKESKDNNSEIKHSFQVGQYCLAFHIDCWYRGKIHSVEDNKYLIYFIDYGDFHFLDEVLPISDKLLLQLPAQAIECSLSGIQHEAECSEEILDKIYDFSDDGAAELRVHVINKNLEPQITKGRKYEINLLNIKGVSLNKMLIDSNLIKPLEESAIQPQNIDITQDHDGSDDNDDEINDYDDYNNEHDDDVDYLEEEVNEKLKTLAISNRFLEEPSGSEKRLMIHKNEIETSENSTLSPVLKADIFDDENAQLFLQDFMSQMFPHLLNTNHDKKDNSKALVKISKNEVQNVSSEENKQSLQEYLYDFYIKTRNKTRSKQALQNIQCFTPQVLWNQNHLEVKIKIMLMNVKSYQLDCSPRNFLFRCLNDGKLYVVNFKLFGAIVAEQTQIQLKTFFVQISLLKMCPLPWPRLHIDEKKFRWINLDVEGFIETEKSNMLSFDGEDIYQIKSEEIGKPAYYRDADSWSSDSENSDENYDSSSESDYSF